MNKMLEQGQITAKDLLPKMIPLMDQLAVKNGALATQLQTAQTAQNRFNITAQEASDTIYKEGMGDGLKVFFEDMTALFEENQGALKSLGRAFEYFFKILSRGLQIVTPVITAAIDNFEILFGAAALASVSAMTAGFQTFGTTAAAAWMAALAPVLKFVAALALVDDYLANWNKNKISTKEALQGYQVVDGKRQYIAKDKDGNYRATGETARTGWVDNTGSGIARGVAGFAFPAIAIGAMNAVAGLKEINLTVTGGNGTPEGIQKAVQKGMEQALHEGNANFTG